ncbi:hypothetical protein SCORR_v1c01570 [Spiroplasma corruscae]|uniref:Uncharacterized protein n=1 Tax=Spiroplasma corruscae TaxID=216934 RepID=A0A222EN63_9MOLU|nr:hypothetical protein SCORR_v1c01570 [Spiroplasma corruscae]
MIIKTKKSKLTILLIVISIILCLLTHTRLDFIFKFINYSVYISSFVLYIFVRFQLWKSIIQIHKSLRIDNLSYKNFYTLTGKEKLYFYTNVIFLLVLFFENLLFYNRELNYGLFFLLFSIIWIVFLDICKVNLILIFTSLEEINNILNNFLTTSFRNVHYFIKKLSSKLTRFFIVLLKYLKMKLWNIKLYIVYKLKCKKISIIKLISYGDNF